MSDTKPQIRLSPPQMAALMLAESHIDMLDTEAVRQRALKADALAVAYAAAADSLRKAHEAYLASTQSRVSIAAPSEMAEAVKSVVLP